eukprot:g940.t1
MATYKSEYRSLADIVLDKKRIKRSADLNGLCMGGTMGMRPDDVTAECATEFVKVFIPAIKKILASQKKKTNLYYIRKMLKKMIQDSDSSENNLASGSEKKSSGADAALLVPKKEYDVLLSTLAHAKSIKKRIEIKSLSMASPLGLRPKGCDENTAVEFVQVFVPKMWEQLKREGKPETMDALRDLAMRVSKSDTSEAADSAGNASAHDAVKSARAGQTSTSQLSLSSMRKSRLTTTPPRMEIDFVPLVDCLLQDQIERVDDIVTLKGARRPVHVQRSTAEKFVDIFIPALKRVMESGKQQFNMQNLKARLLSLTSASGEVVSGEEELQNRTLHYQHQLEDSLIFGLRETYQKIAKSANVVDALAVRRFLQNYDQECDEDDIRAVIRSLSREKSDRYFQFMDFAITVDDQMRKDDRPFEEIFDTMNSDLSGHLKGHELMRWALTIGEKLTRAEVREMLSLVSTKDDLLHFLSRKGKRRFVEMYHAHSGGGEDEGMNAKIVNATEKSQTNGDGTASSESAASSSRKALIRSEPRYKKYFELMDLHMEISDLRAKMAKEDPGYFSDSVDPDILVPLESSNERIGPSVNTSKATNSKHAKTENLGVIEENPAYSRAADTQDKDATENVQGSEENNNSAGDDAHSEEEDRQREVETLKRKVKKLQSEVEKLEKLRRPKELNALRNRGHSKGPAFNRTCTDWYHGSSKEKKKCVIPQRWPGQFPKGTARAVKDCAEKQLHRLRMMHLLHEAKRKSALDYAREMESDDTRNIW